jgi:hypothetical protein
VIATIQIDTGRSTKIAKEPREIVSVWRNASSASGPSTSARTTAAGEKPNIFMKKPTMPAMNISQVSTMLPFTL